MLGCPVVKGTLQYMPPEVLRCPDRACPDLHKERGDLAYGVHADVWAVGVLLHELLMGRTPFQHATTLLTAKVQPTLPPRCATCRNLNACIMASVGINSWRFIVISDDFGVTTEAHLLMPLRRFQSCKLLCWE